MKTIHAMWMEYYQSIYPSGTDAPIEMLQAMHRAFYAGFNGCYNSMNKNSVFYVAKYEKEMDDASEGKYREKL